MLAEKGMTAFDLAGYVEGDCRDEGMMREGKKKRKRKKRSGRLVMPGYCVRALL